MDELTELTSEDLTHLRRCVDLAREALADGDEPFGSVLVGPGGAVLHEDRNRTAGGDQTRHPELELARWAAAHVLPDARPACTVYTSGEHCPMCSAAHAWVGLGRIVFVASAEQIVGWRRDLGADPPPVGVLPVTVVAPELPVDGPVDALVPEVRALIERAVRGD